MSIVSVSKDLKRLQAELEDARTMSLACGEEWVLDWIESVELQIEALRLEMPEQRPIRSWPKYAQAALAKGIRVFALLIALNAPKMAYCEAIAGYEADRLLGAIYQAEGGARARVPYGLISDGWCVELGACKYYAREMVMIHLRRWQKAGASGDFLVYLASKWAPVGASNDPSGLNNHWLKNVRFFLNKGVIS